MYCAVAAFIVEFTKTMEMMDQFRGMCTRCTHRTLPPNLVPWGVSIHAWTEIIVHTIHHRMCQVVGRCYPIKKTMIWMKFQALLAHIPCRISCTIFVDNCWSLPKTISSMCRCQYLATMAVWCNIQIRQDFPARTWTEYPFVYAPGLCSTSFTICC